MREAAQESARAKRLGKKSKELGQLMETVLAAGGRDRPELQALPPDRRPSGENLLHYLALRRHDLRGLQARLAQHGLSSLGRSEPAVFSVLHMVASALAEMQGQQAPARPRNTLSLAQGYRRLEANTDAIFGHARPGRRSRIMVTMPTEAATEPDFLAQCVRAGMDCARINAAHDGPEVWRAIVDRLREVDPQCRILMDLAGPKLRTSPLRDTYAMQIFRPTTDALGRLVEPVQIVIGEGGVPINGEIPAWKPGEKVRIDDGRGRKRTLIVAEASLGRAVLACERKVVLVTGMSLGADCQVGPLPEVEDPLVLHEGDLLRVSTPETRGRMLSDGPYVAEIGCSLPEALRDLRLGHRVFFDDGKIAGEAIDCRPDEAIIRITRAREDGENLRGEKSINLPDTPVQVRSLTEADLSSLRFAAEHADLIGFSFVREAEDVADLQRALADVGRPALPIMLKIETKAGFENLPQLILQSMQANPTAVMIARGDLAVECGFERTAEVQEEILWVCEAAHVPVVWATQVLERLAKSGLPSRAEVTDAAYGERAECVMLNKGPHVIEAIEVLDDILRRMQGHHRKKRALLRRLRAFAG